MDASHVWRATLVTALLNAFGTPLDLVVGSAVDGMPRWPSLTASAVGLATAAFVMIARAWRLQDTRLGSVLIVVNNAAIVAALWVTSGFYAASDLFWAPFQANKLGALAVAMLAPPLWAGLASITAFVGTAVLKLQFFDPAIRANISGEPWVVLIYGVFGVALLVYRLRSLARERQIMRAQMESAAARKWARLLLAVRDRSNTPLQVIAISSAILRVRSSPDQGAAFTRLDRAIDELRALHGMLRRYESDLQWRPGDETLDSVTVLRTAAEQDDAVKNHRS